jgi:hypothetical protein
MAGFLAYGTPIEPQKFYITVVDFRFLLGENVVASL